MREDLRVPTVPVTVEVLLDTAETLKGQVFLPAMASRHSGQPRPDEWVNQPTGFFPFLVEGGKSAVILNKATVAAILFPLRPEFDLEGNTGFMSSVEVTWAGRVAEGRLLINMPAERTRVLDYLNSTDQFIPVWTDNVYYLIRRDCITRIIEREG